MTGSPVCRVLVPSGVLGSGCPAPAFERGLSLAPHVIAVDAGSTDSGPHYLGAGVSKMTRKAVKRDLRQLMIGRARLGIPLLIGSCGTSGTDMGVDWTAEICEETAAGVRRLPDLDAVRHGWEGKPRARRADVLRSRFTSLRKPHAGGAPRVPAERLQAFPNH